MINSPQRTALFWFIGMALAAVLLSALVIAIRSYWDEHTDYVRTRTPDITRHPERTGINGLHEISFASGEARIAAWYAPPSTTRAAIVLVHGVGAERSSLLFEAAVLSNAGFGILSLDLPGQGASGGFTQWGVPERHAIGAAVTWLAQRDEIDAARIGAFGLSMGAYVLAQAAVLDERIAAIALASTPNDVVEFNWLATSRWGLLSQLPCYWALRAAGTPLDMTPKETLGRIAPRPVLLLQGERDGLVPEWMAHQLYASAREPKEIYIVRGAHHADFGKVAPSEYGSELTRFFQTALKSARM